MSTNQENNSEQYKVYLLQSLAFLSTASNMICGLIGILLAIQGNFLEAFRFMLLGVIFDFLDGKFARLAPIKSDWGVYADSFADFVTFGALPGYIILFSGVFTFEFGFISLAFVLAALYAIAAWIRLIRYAAKPTGLMFEGLASSVAAMFVGATVLLSNDSFWTWFFPEILLIPLIFLVSLLMLSTVPYPSPKRLLPLDVIITVSGLIFGVVYIVVPHPLTALLVLFSMFSYTFFGPFYFRFTTNTRFTPEEIANNLQSED